MDFSDIDILDTTDRRKDQVILEILKEKICVHIPDYQMAVIPDPGSCIRFESDITGQEQAYDQIHADIILSALMRHTEELSLIHEPVVIVINYRAYYYSYFTFIIQSNDVNAEFKKFVEACDIISAGKVYCYDKTTNSKVIPCIEIQHNIVTVRGNTLNEFFSKLLTSTDLDGYDDVHVTWQPRVGRVIQFHLNNTTIAGSPSIKQIRDYVNSGYQYKSSREP